jgi:ABC-2 type transport system permease protein
MEISTKQPTSKLKLSWPTLKAAAWLGWQIESNWTDPFLFAIYSIVKPISGAAILIVMYSIISGKDFSSPMFAFIYLGNAFFMLVGAVVQGVSWGIMDDREHYRTLKYLYIAPIRMPVYLIGRSAANFITRLFSVIITLLFGVIFLKLPLNLARVDWPLFLVAFILGFIVMADMGLILGGWTLIIKRNAWTLGESVGAAMFIFSGAIFPLSVLPKALQVIGYIIPVSYWLTLIRRAMIPEVANAYPMFAELSNLQLIAILGAAAVIFSIIAIFSFKRFDYLARERGNIDMVSNY